MAFCTPCNGHFQITWQSSPPSPAWKKKGWTRARKICLSTLTENSEWWLAEWKLHQKVQLDVDVCSAIAELASKTGMAVKKWRLQSLKVIFGLVRFFLHVQFVKLMFLSPICLPRGKYIEVLWLKVKRFRRFLASSSLCKSLNIVVV